MPRKARLDAYGTLHHVMVRGIERGSIFKDDGDREDFLAHRILAGELGLSYTEIVGNWEYPTLQC